MLQMPQTNYHLDYSNPLKKRLSSRMELDYAMALFKFSKSGRVQGLLHSLKYKNHADLGIALGNVYAERMMESRLQEMFDIIIPVPLHPTRKRKRGYNQSAMFAEGLSEKLEIPFSDELVQRKIKTETQTQKTKLHRWENVSEVFEVINVNSIKSKKVLLVDDVVTTGATLEACGNQLLAANCSALSIACIAEA
jgi:ComF family protein